MNVLPATASPTASARRPADDHGDGTGAFGDLLAGAVGHAGGDPAATEGSRPVDTCVAASEDVHDGPGGVAAAVHAAIAAWRADPADVALGAHLREVLRETVHATADPSADVAATDVPAPAPGATPTASREPGGATGMTPVPMLTAPAGDRTPEDPAGEPADQTGAPVPAGASATAGAPSTAGASAAATPAPPTGTDAPAPATSPPMGAATGTTVVTDAASATTPAGSPGDGTTTAEAHRAADTAPTPRATDVADPTTASPADGGPRAPDVASTVARDGGRGVTAAATLDRVLRAVEALEHAPPPRRMSVEVDGVQLSVALRGEEVSVAVRGGGDHLTPGWQRDLATALRGRGLGLAGDRGPGTGSEQSPHRGGDGQPDRPAAARPATQPRPTRAADSAGLRL